MRLEGGVLRGEPPPTSVYAGSGVLNVPSNPIIALPSIGARGTSRRHICYAVRRDFVMRLMTRHRVRHLPVLRYGKLAGVINIGDVGTNHASWRNQLLLEEGKSSLGPLAKRRY
jgi:hypothetical protein